MQIDSATALGAVLPFHDAGAGFLRRLACNEAPFEASDVCVFVAHPDDETIGCGGQLWRLRGASLCILTDGSPPDGQDAALLGDSSAQYARRRRRELRCALARAEASCWVSWYGVVDQQSALYMTAAAYRLAREMVRREVRILLTHAYEGGHPDHDAAACIAALAAQKVRHMRGYGIDVMEMPYYRAEGTGIARQCFGTVGSCDVRIELSIQARDRKARMLAAYESQTSTLQAFHCDREDFRPAPAYDFSQLPNGGELLYERYPWGMTGERWRMLATRAQLACAASTGPVHA